jgi:hypothetical protein
VEGLDKYIVQRQPQVPTCEVTPSGINIRNTAVDGQELDVGVGQGKYTIAWQAKLSDCELRLHQRARRAIVHNTDFTNCRFIAKRKQTSLNWRNVVYDGCTFHGLYLFCEFGFQDQIDPSHPAGMRRCDFSASRLDSCILGNAELSSIILPQLPHLVFLEPGKHQSAIRAIVPEWPVQGFLQNTGFRDDQCSAVAYSQEFLAKNDFPPDQYAALLEGCRRLDFIRLNF